MKKYDNYLRYGILIFLGVALLLNYISPELLNPKRMGSIILTIFMFYLGVVIGRKFIDKLFKKKANSS